MKTKHTAWPVVILLGFASIPLLDIALGDREIPQEWWLGVGATLAIIFTAIALKSARKKISDAETSPTAMRNRIERGLRDSN